MKTPESNFVIKYFDLIDEFIKVRSCSEEALNDLLDADVKDKASYRHRVVEVCVPEFAAEILPAVGKMDDEYDSDIVEELLYQICIDVNPGLEIHQVSLPVSNDATEQQGNVIPRPMQLMYARARPLFVERYGSLGATTLLDIADRVDEVLGGALSGLCEAPLTLAHGDYRLDNLLFTGGGQEDLEVAVIDWQVACHAPGVSDVAYLLTSTLPPECSRSEELSHVVTYHEALLARGVSGYDFEQCLADYTLAVLLLVHRVTTAIVTVEVDNERGVELMNSWIDRIAGRVSLLPQSEIERALALAR